MVEMQSIYEPQICSAHFVMALIFVLVLFLVLPCIYLWWCRKASLDHQPLALPILGHLYLLGKLPHHSLLQIAKKYGPLVKLQLGSVPVMVASSPDMAKEFLKTHDLIFASRPSLLTGKFILYDCKDLVFAPYGEHWRNMRKLCMLELLTERRIALFRSVRMEELSQMMAKLFEASKRHQPVVVLDYLTEFTFNVITRMLMNKVYFGPMSNATEEARQFIKLQEEGTILLGEFHIGDYIPYLKWIDSSINHMKELHKSQDKFLQKIVDEHREKQANVDSKASADFVDIMLSLPFADEKEQDIYIKALIQNLLGAGTDTSITVVQWALAELLNHPQVLQKAQDELHSTFSKEVPIIEESELPKLNYLNAVIKENFRLHPPAPLLIPHQSTEVCKVGDHEIPKGTRLFVNAYAIGRDPSAWEMPEEFVPERFLNSNIDVYGRDFELLPFGAGRRGCPGLSLGLATVQLALANLLHAFDWSLPSGVSSHPMTECFGVVTTMEKPLRAVASPRLPFNLYKSHASI